MHFMLRRRARLAMDTESAPVAAPPQRGRPAVLVAPVPPGGRYALPGERPPSKYAPGEDDGVIDRFDAFARAWHAGGVRYGR